MNWLNFFGSKRKNQLFYSFGIILLVSAVCFALSAFISYKMVALLLLVTLSFIAVVFDIAIVLLSTVFSALIWNFFFIPPRFSFHPYTTEDLILLIMYLIVAIVNSILTYRIRQVEKNARLKEEKANSVKLYNTILNSLSHELRTPIATIIGATDNLQTNDNLSSADKANLIREISKATLRLNQQVENLLNISRLESGHIKPKNDWCDISELVFQVVERVKENSPERKIVIDVNENLPFCFLDEGMLDQILYNLINNAAIHTVPGSMISISASYDSRTLEIAVLDNGQGFGDVDMNEIFQKFSSTEESKTFGRGLGLSIVKGFTDAMGGSILATTLSPRGTKFTVRIPVKISDLQFAHE